MKTEINLLSASQVQASRGDKELVLLRIVSIASVIFAGISSVIIFLIVAQFSPAKIQKEQAGVIQQISAQREKQAGIILVSNRAKDLVKITEKRSRYKEVLEVVISKIPPGTTVNTMSLGEENIEVSVSSNSLIMLDQFISNFLELASTKNIIDSLTIENLSFAPDQGLYTTSIKSKRI